MAAIEDHHLLHGVGSASLPKDALELRLHLLRLVGRGEVDHNAARLNVEAQEEPLLLKLLEDLPVVGNWARRSRDDSSRGL